MVTAPRTSSNRTCQFNLAKVFKQRFLNFVKEIKENKQLILSSISYNTSYGNISSAFQIISFASLFFLALISLERAYALIWPLRHQVASTKGYIYSVTFAWVAGTFAGIFTLLAVYSILDFVQLAFAFGCIMFLCLITVRVSYLAIRTRLNSGVPAIHAAHNRQNGPQQNAK